MPVSVKQATVILEGFLSPTADKRVWDVWISLPDGVNRELVSKAMAKAMTKGRMARSVGRRLNPAYFDLFMAELLKHPTWPETVALQSVPEDIRAAATEGVFKKMTLLINGLGSGFEQRLKLFVKDPVFVQAVIGMVAGATFDFGELRSFLPVLLEVATPEALDVLLPHVQRAIASPGPALDGLRFIIRHRKKPALEPLRALLEGTAAKRPGPLAGERLIRELKIPALKKPLEWRWSTVGTRRTTELEIAMYASFDIEPWFKIRVRQSTEKTVKRTVRVTVKQTVLSSQGVASNELGLTPLPDFFALPQWLAEVKAQLKGSWDAGACLHPAPRKDLREVIERWLVTAPGSTASRRTSSAAPRSPRNQHYPILARRRTASSR